MFRILKMKMQLFQQYFLSMQDKNMRDKITKIGKREMQTRFILVRPLPVTKALKYSIFFACCNFDIFMVQN